MDLNVLTRLLILSVLPAEGDITTIKIVRKLREDLSFGEQEHKDVGLTNDGTQWKWENDIPKAVEIGPKAHAIIAKALKKLSDDGKLTAQYVDVYDKFVDQD